MTTASRSGMRRPSRDELRRRGRSLRARCPRGSHAIWQPPESRPDPIALLHESNKGRIHALIPLRHGRMLASALSFYRGAALNMAVDLASTPVTGLYVQACGDCHLSNFGGFGTPERRVIIDINDLDETLPAPWEWDIKRLAASFILASRHNGHPPHDARDTALTCVRAYRERMAELAELRVLDVWYSDVDLERLIPTVGDAATRLRLERRIKKARARSVLEHDFPKLVTTAEGTATIKHAPPTLLRPQGRAREADTAIVRNAFANYRESLPEHRRRLLDRFEWIDIALKVVGVGSVGRRCFILLLMAGKDDPLFLQIKEARPSVLARYAGRSRHRNEGQRVVIGHHLMQAASDVFLGWSAGAHGRQFYVRQLKDMKIKPLVEAFTPPVMLEYAELCGRILARAHARSGEPAIISGYLGRSGRFDEAIADFASAYADTSERDYQTLVRAVRRGEIDVQLET